MHATQFIRHALECSADAALKLAEDMRDAPLTFPTRKGGNHPLWIVGHCAVAESMLIQEFAFGRSHPLAYWMEIFGPGSTPVDDASAYPSFETVLRTFKETRAATMAGLGTLTDADLDRPSAAPKEFAQFVGTIGQCYLHTITHLAVHTGQLADARRAIGREPLLFRPPVPERTLTASA